MKDKAKKLRWFCKKHGLEGVVGKDWCFGCYKLDDNTEMPVSYIGYKNNISQNARRISMKITEVTLKIVVNGEEKIATFIRPEKIKSIISDKDGKMIDWIEDLIDAK